MSKSSSDGTVIPCDFFVVTAGVRSNVEFLQDSGLELSRFGLVYGASGQTNDPDIYGAGDVSGLSPIWPVAVKEGMIAAANMCGVPEKMTDFFASKSTMRFLDISTMSLGNVNPDPEDRTIKVETYRKGMIARKIDVTKVKKPLFEIDYSDFFHEKANLEFAYEL